MTISPHILVYLHTLRVPLCLRAHIREECAADTDVPLLHGHIVNVSHRATTSGLLFEAPRIHRLVSVVDAWPVINLIVVLVCFQTNCMIQWLIEQSA